MSQFDISSSNPRAVEHEPVPSGTDLRLAQTPTSMTEAEVITSLTARVNQLSLNLARAERERSEGAAYAVQAEDKASLLQAERQLLMRMLKHLYQHMTDPAGQNETYFDCPELHPKLKEYLS